MVEIGFAPADPTDGRESGDWESRYSAEAWKHIRFDAKYLSWILAFDAVLIATVWILYRGHLLSCLSTSAQTSLCRHVIAWLSGTLGGVLFAMKWLYHSVAKKIWNYDRRLWRLFTPHISGGLAFGTICVIESIALFDPSLVSNCSRIAAIGFLVGFFSDTALAKLAEVADILFGPSRRAGNPSKREVRRTDK